MSLSGNTTRDLGTAQTAGMQSICHRMRQHGGCLRASARHSSLIEHELVDYGQLAPACICVQSSSTQYDFHAAASLWFPHALTQAAKLPRTPSETAGSICVFACIVNSSFLAQSMTVASLQGRPMIWSPIGMCLSSQATGTLIAGSPIRFAEKMKRMIPPS